MAAGLPVICYGVGGAAESVTPEFGIRFGVQAADAIVEALRLLGTRTFDPDAARAHAAQFDVTRFRSEYRDVVKAAIDKHFSAPHP